MKSPRPKRATVHSRDLRKSSISPRCCSRASSAVVAPPRNLRGDREHPRPGESLQPPGCRRAASVPEQVHRVATRRAVKAMAAPTGVAVAGVALSHPDKLLYPEAALSKQQLARYYESVGERIVPHLKDRPLSLVRCPDGWNTQCFYQKHAEKSVNAAVERVTVPEGKSTATYMAANSVKAVVALLQWGVLELHPWGSRVPRLDRPDRLIFDFDPDDKLGWEPLADAARLTRRSLEDLGLQGFLKTTGGKGLHVVVPIRPTLDWDQAKSFTKSIADLFVRAFPARFTATFIKGRAQESHFHRLSSQRRWRHCHCAVFAACTCQRTGGDAHRLGRAGDGRALRSFQRRKRRRKTRQHREGSVAGFLFSPPSGDPRDGQENRQRRALKRIKLGADRSRG